MAFVALAAVALLMSAPVAAQQNQQNQGNQASGLICEGNNNNTQTDLGSLVSNITFLIVTLSGLIAVVGGAGFTLASAAQPTNEEYQERRNKSVMYGGGTLLVMYGANALISQLDPALDFGCVLPLLN